MDPSGPSAELVASTSSSMNPNSSDQFLLPDHTWDNLHEFLLLDTVSNGYASAITVEFNGTTHKRHAEHFKELKQVKETNGECAHTELKSGVAIGVLVRVPEELIKQAESEGRAVPILPPELKLALTFNKDALKEEMIRPCDKHKQYNAVLDRFSPQDQTIHVDTNNNTLHLYTQQTGKAHEHRVAQFSIVFRCLSSDGVGNHHDKRVWRLTLMDLQGNIYTSRAIKVKAEIKFPELGGCGRKRLMKKSASEAALGAPPIKREIVEVTQSMLDGDAAQEQANYLEFMAKVEKEGVAAAYNFARTLPQKPPGWIFEKK